MDVVEVVEDRSGAGLSIGIAVSTFNEAITSGLLAGALSALEAAGADRVEIVRVAGALELPVLVQRLAGRHDAVVAVGAVIEGETDHYVHVATEASAGLRQVALETGVPVGNALLTVRHASHARDRSRPGPGNKGAEAAMAAIVAVRALQRLH